MKFFTVGRWTSIAILGVVIYLSFMMGRKIVHNQKGCSNLKRQKRVVPDSIGFNISRYVCQLTYI